MINCTRCDCTGFLNAPDDLPEWDEWENDQRLNWIANHPETDAQVCDCCGNGEAWYGEPGKHDVLQHKREFGYLPACY